MRNLVLVFIILLTVSCNLKQEEKTEKVDTVEAKEPAKFVEREVNPSDTIGLFEFISLFKEKQPETEIVDSLRARFLNLNWTENEKKYAYINCVADSVLFEREKVIGLVYTINCMAGGQCLTNHLAIFSKKGYLISQEKVGYEMAGLEHEDKMTYILNNDRLILVTENTITNDDGEALSTKSDTSVMTIDTNTWEIK